MEDFMILIDLKVSEESVEILCYSGDFNAAYDDEEPNCHRYVLACEPQQIKEFDKEAYRDSSSVHIDMNQNRIYLQNDWSLAEDDFHFLGFQVFHDSTGRILTEKIKHIRALLENERLSTRNAESRLHEISRLIFKELDVDQRKATFFRTQKKREQLASTQAKIKIAEEVRAILERSGIKRPG